MGAALVGGALASLGIGEAAADECKRAGKQCKKNSQCCSGNCSTNGTCSACPSGTVELSNGTCARIGGVPCDCPPGCLCRAELDPAGSRNICGSIDTGKTCASHVDCPEGQFCSPTPAGGTCVVAC
jgi:hypothetical protein